jgi:hypothetical protein
MFRRLLAVVNRNRQGDEKPYAHRLIVSEGQIAGAKTWRHSLPKCLDHNQTASNRRQVGQFRFFDRLKGPNMTRAFSQDLIKVASTCIVFMNPVTRRWATFRMPSLTRQLLMALEEHAPLSNEGHSDTLPATNRSTSPLVRFEKLSSFPL